MDHYSPYATEHVEVTDRREALMIGYGTKRGDTLTILTGVEWMTDAHSA